MHPDPLPDPSRDAARPTRRAVARSAVWSVPVIAVGAAAPALAASPTGAPTLPGYTAEGWEFAYVGSPTSGGYTLDNATFNVTGNPLLGATNTAWARHPLDVVAGETYTFQYSWTANTSDPNPMTSELRIDGATQLDSTIDTSSGQTSGTVTTMYVAAATTTVSVMVYNSVTATLPGNADDISVGPITVVRGV